VIAADGPAAIVIAPIATRAAELLVGGLSWRAAWSSLICIKAAGARSHIFAGRDARRSCRPNVNLSKTIQVGARLGHPGVCVQYRGRQSILHLEETVNWVVDGRIMYDPFPESSTGDS
jgi:hypothetical protein